MGIFGRLFGDPERDLERAQSCLAKGEAGRAFELASRAEKASSGAAGRRAAEVLARARDAVVDEALAKAELAVASEYYEDAAEWLRSTLEHVDGARRSELEARIGSLLDQHRESEAGEPFDPGLGGSEETGPRDAGLELDVENHFLALIGTLRDQVADLYEKGPAGLRAACVDFNEGRVEAAREALDALAEELPDDPVVRLERGRCRLVSGDPAGAGADFEAAWESWGDEPLDLAGALSVPGLWADAQLARGETEPVVERLAELAAPSRGRADLAQPYALALVKSERFDAAEAYLSAVAGRFPADQDLPLLLARVLGRRGDRAAGGATRRRRSRAWRGRSRRAAPQARAASRPSISLRCAPWRVSISRRNGSSDACRISSSISRVPRRAGWRATITCFWRATTSSPGTPKPPTKPARKGCGCRASRRPRPPARRGGAPRSSPYQLKAAATESALSSFSVQAPI